ncbi:uncharacterized protein PGRI_070070 [Penicillium griseofulvum]|uniref:Uncharacterized protein n=1 Tax=Penicillium patulum TaxID=5078 RepID=A0A135LNH6_PENPA|nr:uncharacterized protein PGRI_070070 [Penicillium griseofulvum]KXG50516.1 hypothetical protein PGRI_070070 [Penicillium griseofulvum]
MSSPKPSHDPVDNESRTMAGYLEPTVPHTSQQMQLQRDALVALDEVITKLIVERGAIEDEIIRQRAVLAYQLTRRSAIDDHIRNLQDVWNKMAAGFEITSNK